MRVCVYVRVWVRVRTYVRACVCVRACVRVYIIMASFLGELGRSRQTHWHKDGESCMSRRVFQLRNNMTGLSLATYIYIY